MLRVGAPSISTDNEEAKAREPSDRKRISEERTIYKSRSFRSFRANAYGLPVLCDFGGACIETPQAYSEIQTDGYIAPKILMQSEWSHSADIWKGACLVRYALLLRWNPHGILT
jgi:serine/threonine-protein kinase SRPK3